MHHRLKLLLIAAVLAMPACALNKPPAPSTASHPPAADLRCLAEPDALTDAQAEADADGKADDAFNDAVLISGRSCRDALGRVCQWHKDRGDTTLVCEPVRKTVPPKPPG